MQCKSLGQQEFQQSRLLCSLSPECIDAAWILLQHHLKAHSGFNIKPVPDVQPISIDGNRLPAAIRVMASGSAFLRVGGTKLLCNGDHNWKAIGLMVGRANDRPRLLAL